MCASGEGDVAYVSGVMCVCVTGGLWVWVGGRCV